MAARVLSPLVAGLAGVMIAVYTFEPALKEEAIEKTHGPKATKAFATTHQEAKSQSESPILTKANPSVAQLITEEAQKGLQKKS